MNNYVSYPNNLDYIINGEIEKFLDVEPTLHCEKCECQLDDEYEMLDDTLLCLDCYDNYTVTCNHCYERMWDSNNCGDIDSCICQSCYDKYYTTCDECDCIILIDDSCSYHDRGSYCRSCYDNILQIESINAYDYKPTPVFYGKGIFYGIELEIDGAGENEVNAQTILDIANINSDNIYIKHDGSLLDGFEIVTHPMSLIYHQKQMLWKNILCKALEMGYRSHDTNTCGLHIHCGRSALGSDYDSQEDTISNILYLVEIFWDKLLIFSRRTESQIKKWASRYGLKNSPKEILDYAKQSMYSRYVCVNLQNESTIEFRMFRGTLNYQTLIATIQLVDEICQVAIIIDNNELKKLTWQKFVNGINFGEKSELTLYLQRLDLIGEGERKCVGYSE